MKKQQLYTRMLFLAGIITFSAILVLSTIKVSLVSAQAAPKTTTGEWIAELNRTKSREIHFTFHRGSEEGGLTMNSKKFLFSELQGLTLEAASTGKRSVIFNIVREAGTFTCEGYFNEDKGAGFWTLLPDEKFISAMRSLGYNNLTDVNLSSAALNNLTTKFVEDLKSAGYDRVEFKELLRARTHGITSAYAKEVQGMGFEQQPIEKLIRMRNHDITGEFVRQMRSIGFKDLSIEELIRLKNHDITPEYINNLKAEGYSNIAPEIAIRLKNNQIDRDFIRRAKAQGYGNVAIEELIRLANRSIIK